MWGGGRERGHVKKDRLRIGPTSQCGFRRTVSVKGGRSGRLRRLRVRSGHEDRSLRLLDSRQRVRRSFSLQRPRDPGPLGTLFVVICIF